MASDSHGASELGDPNSNRWQMAVTKPIQKMFHLLVKDIDPSKMIDLLFAREIIDQQDMDKITAEQTQQGRVVAARTLLRGVIAKASAEQSMSPVSVFIEALREAGFGHLADDVKKLKDEVEKTHRIGEESSAYTSRLRGSARPRRPIPCSGDDEIDNPNVDHAVTDAGAVEQLPYTIVESKGPMRNWLAAQPGEKGRRGRVQPHHHVSEGVTGIFFGDMPLTRVSRIFLEIARTFEDNCQEILTCLLLSDDRQQLLERNKDAPEKFRKQRLLTDGLDIWSEKTPSSCGKQLFEILLQAHCDKEKLEIFKRPLGLPEDFVATNPAYPVQESRG